MTPHEVIKDSLEKFEEKYKEVWSSKYSQFIRIPDGIKGNMVSDIKSSHLSLLLSVKEMVDVARKNCIEPSGWDDISNHNRGRIEGIEYIQSLLDSEINKIKEL